MPHPELGRIGFLLGGGGCAEGLPQAVQIQEFWKAGIRPDYIAAFSVGVFNALDLENALHVWEGHFDNPWAIYDLNPDIKKFLLNIYKSIPEPLLRKHKGSFDLWSDWYKYKKKKYKNFKELWIDIRNLKSYAKQIVSSLPILPENTGPSSKDLAPFLQNLITLIREFELNKVESFFEPSPLIKTLSEVLDFERIFERKTALHIFARSWSKDYIFSCGEDLSRRATKLISENYRIYRLESPKELLLATMASSAIRPFFSPVCINGTAFWDSGIVNPYPIECAMDAECDTIFAFIKNHKEKNGGDLDIFSGLVESSDEAARRRFLDQQKMARLREKLGGRKPHMIVKPAPLHPDLDLLWISPVAMEYTIKTEREATRKWLKESLNIESPAE